MSTGLMAKPKRSKPGPKPDPANARSEVVRLRCRPSWKEWLVARADDEGQDVAGVIDAAVLFYARHRGWEMPPER